MRDTKGGPPPLFVRVARDLSRVVARVRAMRVSYLRVPFRV